MKNPPPRSFWRTFFITALMMLALTGPQSPGAAQRTDAAGVGKSDLLQLEAGGCVLGFGAGEFYVASPLHMARIEFVDARSRMPALKKAAPPERSDPKGEDASDKVIYENPWDGVTIVYEFRKGAVLKSTYHVAPRKNARTENNDGSPHERIRLRYNAPIRLAANGDLALGFETGLLLESAPIAWQEIDGQKKPVRVAFRLFGEHEAGFRVEGCDPAFPLVIDPTMTWTSFMGSRFNDYGRAIAVDGSGNVYIAGDSEASWGAPVSGFQGGSDAFIAKLNQNGQVRWNTFLGGVDNDNGHAIGVDGSGNVYIAGASESGWGSPVNSHVGGSDAFVASLDDSGRRRWHTFLGGPVDDYAYALAVDAAGNVYAGGAAGTTWGSPLNDHAGWIDAFAARLSDSGRLRWITFLGGAADDHAYAAALDDAGSLYLTGSSDAEWGSPIRGHGGWGWSDAFAAELSADGRMQWNTFLGGGGNDVGKAIAVDDDGAVYVGGESASTWGAPINSHAGSIDVFAARLDGAGRLQWSTFIGSNGDDRAAGAAAFGSGHVYLTGDSPGSWGSPLNAHSGQVDVFAIKLDGSGGRQWSAFMGGPGAESGGGVAAGASGVVYVAGSGPTAWGAPVNNHGGMNDAFAAPFSPDADGCIPLDSNLDFTAPCMDASGTRFGIAFINKGDGKWDADVSTFSPPSGDSDCITIDSLGDFTVPCMELSGTLFGIDFVYTGDPYSWVPDMNSAQVVPARIR